MRPHGDGALLFAHALIRDGVYDLLLKSRRRELHRRAAALFAGRDPVLHAEHVDRAEDPGAPRAYLKAARAQAGAYRTEAALALIERGIALAHERADVFALTCYRGEVLHDLGRIVESMNAYRDALEAADDGHHPALEGLPKVTYNADGIPADPLNVALVGDEAEVVRAMLAAHWHPADPITLHSS